MKNRYLACAAVLSGQLVAFSAVGGLLAPAQAAAGADPDPSPVSAGSPGSEGDAVGSTDWGDVAPGEADDALTSQGVWSAARDSGSLYALEASRGIHDLWARGITGKGVTVAVVDTGIALVEGLDEGRVVNGPDLSFDAQAGVTPYVDAFGHGTHLAGIIAGHDEHWDRKKPNPSQFAGVAPEATLLNVKVGASDGGADVSQVIAALDWITQHRDDKGLDVRVISLAYGTASVQPWQEDPLAHAVESAWRAGIVVVAAAGNDGLDAPSLLMPAVDPHVIAVGGLDQQGTDAPADDTVADFTNGGNDLRRPDVVVPGRSVVSLRVPGSYADTMSPEGRVEGDATGRFFRGSGTSQATAFAAGEVALLLSERPKLTPDQVKALLVGTARPLAEAQPAQGAGATDLRAAVAARVPADVATAIPFSSGTGSLELSRGGEHVVDPATGVALSGEVDVLGGAWDAAAWPAASTQARAWTRGVWNGRVWTGDRFKSHDWELVPWVGATWGGEPWASHPGRAQWVARSWRGDSWEARSWRSESWRARSWRSLG